MQSRPHWITCGCLTAKHHHYQNFLITLPEFQVNAFKVISGLRGTFCLLKRNPTDLLSHLRLCPSSNFCIK